MRKLRGGREDREKGVDDVDGESKPELRVPTKAETADGVSDRVSDTEFVPLAKIARAFAEFLAWRLEPALR